jgi:hypothetical protein
VTHDPQPAVFTVDRRSSRAHNRAVKTSDAARWRLVRASAAISLMAALGCASQPTARTRLPSGVGESRIVDLASEFLSTACRAAPGKEFAEAWLAYEDRHQGFYETLYYGSTEDRSERRRLANEMAQRRDEMCGHVRSFLVAAPGTIDVLRGRVAELVGARPQGSIFFSVALQWTDGRADSFQGREVLALNARHDTFARTSGLAATVAHELIHDAQTIASRGEDAQLPSMARSLYREGAAVFGVQLLFPELGNRALGLRPEQVERAEIVAPQAAAEVLGLLRRPDAGRDLRRFFQGGYADECYPPKMGYYLGGRIFQDIAEKEGTRTAIRTGPKAFLERAESILGGISKQTRGPIGTRVDLPAIVQLRDRFLGQARRAGIVMPFTPEMREWTRPSMISWRQEARAVAIPKWDELGEPQRRLLELMAGDRSPQQLFNLLFRWFLVPHELTHALQENAEGASHPDHAAGERLANDSAVAFLKEDPEARRFLFALAPLLVSAKQRLPRLPVDGDEEALERYFNEHYDELGRDLPQYAAFQVMFILDSLRRLDALRFEEVVGRATLAPRENR